MMATCLAWGSRGKGLLIVMFWKGEHQKVSANERSASDQSWPMRSWKLAESLMLQQVPPDPQTVLSFTKLLRERRGKSSVSGLFCENCVISGPLPRSDSLSQYLGWIQFHQRTLSNIYSSFKRRKKMCNVK